MIYPNSTQRFKDVPPMTVQAPVPCSLLKTSKILVRPSPVWDPKQFDKEKSKHAS
jgi:hypothetical protein